MEEKKEKTKPLIEEDLFEEEKSEITELSEEIKSEEKIEDLEEKTEEIAPLIEEDLFEEENTEITEPSEEIKTEEKIEELEEKTEETTPLIEEEIILEPSPEALVEMEEELFREAEENNSIDDNIVLSEIDEFSEDDLKSIDNSLFSEDLAEKTEESVIMQEIGESEYQEDKFMEEMEDIFSQEQIDIRGEGMNDKDELEEDEIPILFNELEDESEENEDKDEFGDIGELLGNIDEDSDLSQMIEEKPKNIFDDDILEELEFPKENKKEEKAKKKQENKENKTGGIRYFILKNKYKIFVIFIAAVLISIIMVMYKPIEITGEKIYKKSEIVVEGKNKETTEKHIVAESVKTIEKNKEKIKTTEEIKKIEKVQEKRGTLFDELDKTIEKSKDATGEEKKKIEAKIEELNKKIKDMEEAENKKMELRLIGKIEENIMFTESEIIKSNGINVVLLLKNKKEYDEATKQNRQKIHRDLYKVIKTVFDSEEKVNMVNISVISEGKTDKKAEITARRYEYERVKEDSDSYDTMLSNFRLIER